MRLAKFSYLIFLICFIVICKPAELSNPCDPKSESYITSSILRFLTNDNSPSCLPGFPKPPTWGVHSDSLTNVEVLGMAIHNNKLYLGGIFQFLGPNTGGAAILNTVDGTLLDSNSCPYLELLSFSNVAISDERGGFYLAGNFSHLQGIAKQSLVHIQSNCKLDTNFDVGTGSGGSDIRDLLLVGEKIYIAGSFSTWNGSSRQNLAAVNRITGVLDTTWVPSADATVESILGDTDGIFIAGQFTSINASGIGRLAKISYDTGSTYGSFSANISAGAIRTIAIGRDVSNNKVIYAGGSFTAVSPANVKAFEMDGNMSAWNPAPNGLINDIAVLGSKVYLIGTFNLLGSTARINFAAVDNTGTVGGEDLGLSGSDTIASITEFGGKIYMLGNFTSIGGKSRRHGFSVDPSNGKISDWNPSFTTGFSYPNGKIAFSSDGSKVLVPGSYYSVNVVERNGFGSIDLNTGKPTDFNPQLTGTAIRSLHVRDHLLYAGGQFTSVLNSSRTNFFILNLNTLNLEGPAPTFNSNVESITTDENYIYVGGSFSNVAGTARSNIARLMLTNGTLDSWNPIGDGNVSSIHLLKDKVFVGGSFTNIGGSNTSYITSLNPINGINLLFPSATSFPNAYVSTIATYQNQLFIGGNFTIVGGQSTSRFSSFDLTTGSYSNQLLTTDNIVSTISIGENGKGMIGGYFTTINGSTKEGFVYYDFLNGRLLNSNVPSSGDVYKSFAVKNTHYFGGKINQVNNRPKGGFYFVELNN